MKKNLLQKLTLKALALGVIATLPASFYAQTAVGEKNGDGSFKKWHRIEIQMDGPNVKEEPSTFRNYRLDVTFKSPSNKTYVVPGFFDADGDPANSGKVEGNVWKARFSAGEEGNWTYTVSFVKGTDVAANLSGGIADNSLNGKSGSFKVGTQDKSGKDFRAKGKLQYVGEHYLQFANGDYFLKCGANSPEVLMADQDFDGIAGGNNSGNVDHSFQVGEWQTGDPSWKNGKGKGIIGVVNYLSKKGVNSHYFLSMNIGGDGKRTFPYVNESSPYTFDVSKLGQWELVFSQFDKKGLMINFQTQETENMQFFENKEGGTSQTTFSVARKIYYRELVARFGHHLAITWDIGEENNANFTESDKQNTLSQRRAFAERLRALAYYEDMITIHNGPNGNTSAINLFTDLLNNENYHGTSLQLDFGIAQQHKDVLYWWNKTDNTSQKWVVCNDEPYKGAGFDNLTELRKETVWGSVMAGGHMEWYHGAGADLKTNLNYASFDGQWAAIGHCANFMNNYFAKTMASLRPSDNLVNNNNYCLSHAGNSYIIYLRNGGTANLNLNGQSGKKFEVKWYDPRNGGSLKDGSVTSVNGGGSVGIGNAPSSGTSDWVVLIRNKDVVSSVEETSVNEELNRLYVYPNPSESGVYYLSEDTQWEVFTLIGESIAKGESDQIDISNQVKGMYLVKTEQGILKVQY